MSKELVEAIARAYASETLSLAFMEPHPIEGSLAAKCRDADRQAAFKAVRVMLASIEREGFKVVPVEPTEEMLDAGTNELAGFDWVDGSKPIPAKTIYRAMLAAIPKQE